ncbi:MAG: hypothetical protein AVDCRST_MAG50-1852 [uncultured Acidimicrobiales bacterium]|uniref:Uncharacterized protein n=1 Tax=uncultured Acidimicrobiales bacterium TaxID=310071 RepID=A0A6J4I6J4_9ACTN|nr:MAG: hypothetical protein AVDCRST_MAG50-1852 [uncultured Acidimicrobiales bacterium]
MTDEDVEVRLLGVPIALSGAAREHFDEMSREFVYIANSDESVRRGAPGRLLELVDELQGRFAALTASSRETLDQAAGRGQETADLTLRLPATIGQTVAQLGTLIDEVDRYCESGTHLLTLKTPPGPLAYRHWYRGQITAQLAGAAPVPFADWLAAERPTG